MRGTKFSEFEECRRTRQAFTCIMEDALWVMSAEDHIQETGQGQRPARMAGDSSSELIQAMTAPSGMDASRGVDVVFRQGGASTRREYARMEEEG